MADRLCRAAAHAVLPVRLALSLLCALLVWPAWTAADEPDSAGAREAYRKAIQQANSDLQAGKIEEARKRLESTEKSLRGFEAELLGGRAKIGTEGKAAGSLIRRIAHPDVEVRYGVLLDPARQVVFLCRDGSLRVYDLAAPETARSTAKHPEGVAIWSGAVSRDGKTFFSGHQNGEVLVWDTAKWELKHRVSLGEDWPVRELAAAPDGSGFVAETKGALELWSLGEAEPGKVAAVGERYNFGEGLSYSPAGDLIATGGMFDILLHDAKTGKHLRSMSHASYTMGLAFSPDGRRIASAPRGNVNKFLAVFDVTRDAPEFNAGPFANYITGLAFSPDGRRIAATGCEKRLRLFDAASGEILLEIERSDCGSKPAFSSDGQILGWSEPLGYRFIDLKNPHAGTEDEEIAVP